MIDETANDPAANAERVGFCQDCGRPLTRETVRTVGSGVFCEPCLEARLGNAGPVAGAGVPPSSAGAPPLQGLPPIGGSDPSPVLAALLGLIPGVGAMYNGQFAKGIAHIVIFALLESMSHVSGFFGALLAGWVFYQSFEAYHTAKARREGLPLPDPFNLNNIGAHVGVHFRGATAGAAPNAGQPGGWTGYTQPGYTPAGYTPTGPIVTPPPAQPADAWGSVPGAAPVSPYAQSAPYTPPVPVWDTPAWTPPPAAATPVAGQEWANVAPTYPGAPSYPVIPARRSNIPGAAAWLIGLGVIFLLINVLPGWRFGVHRVFPFLLMTFAVWLFVRRMLSTGGISPVEGEGEGYAARALCFLRLPAFLFTVSVLWALQEFDVLRFGQTWPVLVILVGVLMLLERSFGGRVVPVAPVVDATAANDTTAAGADGKGV